LCRRLSTVEGRGGDVVLGYFAPENRTPCIISHDDSPIFSPLRFGTARITILGDIALGPTQTFQTLWKIKGIAMEKL
jgi:hypothetical protein